MFSPFRSQKRFPLARRLTLKNIATNQNGMTLIEIMIVIAILAGLITVLGSTVMNRFRESRVSQTKLQIRELGKQLDAYNLQCGSYPTTDQGLQALLTAPGDACPNWGPEPYIKKNMLKDMWGTAFTYESDGSKYEVRSLGQDKKPGGSGYDKDLSSSDE